MVNRRLLMIFYSVLVATGCGNKSGSAAADSASANTGALANCVVGTSTVGNCKIN